MASESDYGYTLRNDGKIASSSTSYGYGSGASYALGAVTSQSSSSYVSGAGGGSSWSTTTNGYLWYDGALQSYLGQANGGVGGTTNWSTSFTYDALGRLASASVHDGKPRTVTFTNDELGQVIRRDESWVAGQSGAPHEVWYRFGGRQLGYTGNNGTSEMAMAASIEDRRVAPPTSNQGTFRNKQLYGSAYADFAQSYDPLNSYGQGSAGGSYTVQRGDTLQSIARASWGDANLWYAIAEANGLGASTTLIEGQRLTLPAGVVRTANNAGTLKPYDPASALGDVTPGTAPQAQAGRRGNKCGTFGAILLIAVAVAVAAWLGPQMIGHAVGATLAGGGTAATATGLTVALGGTAAATGSAAAIGAGVIGGTLAGAAGSIASQALGLATGIQEKFSWSAVAMAGLSGGVGGGLGGAGILSGGKGLTAALQGAARGALSNAATQGLALAAGLQGKFDWAGVAVGAAVGGAVGATRFGGIAGRLTSGLAGALAGGAARTLIDGSDFGDNVLAALPDVIGSTIGEMVAGALSGAGRSATAPNNAYAQAQTGPRDDLGRLQDIRSDAVSPPPDEPDTVYVYGHRAAAAVGGFFSRLWHDPVGTIGGLFHGYSRSQAQSDALALRMSIGRAIHDAPRQIGHYNILASGLRAAGLNRAAAIVSGAAEAPWRAVVNAGEAIPGFATRVGSGAYNLAFDRSAAWQNMQAFGTSLSGAPSAFTAHVGGISDDLASGNVVRMNRGAVNAGVLIVDVGSVVVPLGELNALRGASTLERANLGTAGAGAAETVTARSLPNQLGRAGELVSAEVTGLPRNTLRIPSASGAKGYRIPDHLEPLDQLYIAETKNVKYRTLTSQILDDVAHVNRSGYPGRVDVIIDSRTTISGPLLREHLNPGSPIKIRTMDLNRR